MQSLDAVIETVILDIARKPVTKDFVWDVLDFYIFADNKDWLQMAMSDKIKAIDLSVKRLKKKGFVSQRVGNDHFFYKKGAVYAQQKWENQ